jgi:hypothetical protein
VPVHARVHRVLVRNGLVKPKEQVHKRKYRRWQRDAPMQLWQMSPACRRLTGGKSSWLLGTQLTGVNLERATRSARLARFWCPGRRMAHRS